MAHLHRNLSTANRVAAALFVLWMAASAGIGWSLVDSQAHGEPRDENLWVVFIVSTFPPGALGAVIAAAQLDVIGDAVRTLDEADPSLLWVQDERRALLTNATCARWLIAVNLFPIFVFLIIAVSLMTLPG